MNRDHILGLIYVAAFGGVGLGLLVIYHPAVLKWILVAAMVILGGLALLISASVLGMWLRERREADTREVHGKDDRTWCAHCGGRIAVRNPTGQCDHLYWPENLTDEAKRANGFVPVTRTTWNAGRQHLAR